MKLELTTDRLFLRPLSMADKDLGLAAFTDPEVMRYIGGKTYTKEKLEQELPQAVKRGGGGCIGVWCVIERATNEKLGTSILLPMPIEEDDTNWDLVVEDKLPDCDIEIGYILKKAAWGKGYATEAARRLLRFAFEETPLEEIVASIDERNTASRRVLEKCGLIYEGIGRAYATDTPVFRITKQQWVEQQRLSGKNAEGEPS